MNARAQLAKAVREKDFQEDVRQLALLHGWRDYYHTHDSRHSPEGFPDVICIKGERLLVAELKKEGKEPTAAQERWLAAFRRTCAEVYVWHPSDMPDIIEILSR